MRVDRLNKLADHLDTIDPTEFTMRFWVHNCGSPACAFGHATTIFPELRIDVKRHHVMYNGYYNEDAASIFFDLDLEDVNEIFMPSAYDVDRDDDITPSMVAAKIREVIKNNVQG